MCALEPSHRLIRNHCVQYGLINRLDDGFKERVQERIWNELHG